MIPVDDDGQILLDEYATPAQRPHQARRGHPGLQRARHGRRRSSESSSSAHRAGALVLVDGAQSVSHMPVDVAALDADFFVFSGHKIFGPTGIGVVYGKPAVLEAMPPWQGGGNMITDVTLRAVDCSRTRPTRFEAGTGNIADAVGLGAALDYVERTRHREHRAATNTTC